MSRLIDADALIERKFILHDMEELTHEEFEKLVNEQPTTFDTEKVVAELEDKFEQAVAEILDKTGSDFTIADFNVKRYSDRICEIVRKGGV